MCLLSIFLVGCGEKECSSHSYLSETIKKATCLEDGEIKYTCENCDYEEIKTIVATGHDWVKDIVLLEPTFFQEGIQKYKCDNCFAEKEQTISKVNKEFPKTPLVITTNGDIIKFTLIEYKWSKYNSYINYECEIINKANNFTSIPFVIYDGDGFIVDSGHIYINGYYQSGSKFKGEALIDVEINERFRAVIG